MNCYEVFFLAVALSIDACVVSFSYGLCLEKRKRLNAFLLALTTGFFQGFMPILGYYFTNIIRKYVYSYEKWIVFIIFGYLGITFIANAFRNEKKNMLCLDIKTLLLIGIATSIDAFSAGISLSLTDTPLVFSVLVIGIITFIDSILGYSMGYWLKKFNPKYMEIFGGIILLCLALRALL